MDSRGIPVVATTNASSTPRHLPPIHKKKQPSSNFLFASLKNETSLLEAYDSFSNDCFNGSFARNYYNAKTPEIAPIIVNSNYASESFHSRKRKEDTLKKKAYNSLPSTPQCSPPFPPPPAPTTPRNDSSQYHTTPYSPIFPNFFDSYQIPLHDSTGVPPLEHYTSRKEAFLVTESSEKAVLLEKTLPLSLPVTISEKNESPITFSERPLDEEPISVDLLQKSLEKEKSSSTPAKYLAKTAPSAILLEQPVEEVSLAAQLQSLSKEKAIKSRNTLEKETPSVDLLENELGKEAPLVAPLEILPKSALEREVSLAIPLETLSENEVASKASEDSSLKNPPSLALKEKIPDRKTPFLSLQENVLDEGAPLLTISGISTVQREEVSEKEMAFVMLPKNVPEVVSPKEALEKREQSTALLEDVSKPASSEVSVEKEALSSMLSEILSKVKASPMPTKSLPEKDTSSATFQKDPKEREVASIEDVDIQTATPMEVCFEEEIIPLDQSVSLTQEAASSSLPEEQANLDMNLATVSQSSAEADNVKKEQTPLSEPMSQSTTTQTRKRTRQSLKTNEAMEENINEGEKSPKRQTRARQNLKTAENIDVSTQKVEEGRKRQTRSRQGLNAVKNVEEVEDSKKQTKVIENPWTTETIGAITPAIKESLTRQTKSRQSLRVAEIAVKSTEEVLKDSKKKIKDTQTPKATEDMDVTTQEIGDSPKRQIRSRQSSKTTKGMLGSMEEDKSVSKKQIKVPQGSEAVESEKESTQKTEDIAKKQTRASRNLKISETVKETNVEPKKIPKKRTKTHQDPEIIKNVEGCIEKEERNPKRQKRSHQSLKSFEAVEHTIQEAENGFKELAKSSKALKRDEHEKEPIQKGEGDFRNQMTAVETSSSVLENNNTMIPIRVTRSSRNAVLGTQLPKVVKVARIKKVVDKPIVSKEAEATSLEEMIKKPVIPKAKRRAGVYKRSAEPRETRARAAKITKEAQKEKSIEENNQQTETIIKDKGMLTTAETVSSDQDAEENHTKDSKKDVPIVDALILNSPNYIKTTEDDESMIDILSLDETDKNINNINKEDQTDGPIGDLLQENSSKCFGLNIEKPGSVSADKNSGEPQSNQPTASRIENSKLQIREHSETDTSKQEMKKELSQALVSSLENSGALEMSLSYRFLDSNAAVKTTQHASKEDDVQLDVTTSNDIESSKDFSLEGSKENGVGSNIGTSAMSNFKIYSEGDVNFEEADKTKFGNETVFMESILSDEMPISTIGESIAMSFTEDGIVADAADRSSQDNNYKMSEETEKQAMNQVESWIMDTSNKYAEQESKDKKEQDADRKDTLSVSKSRKTEKNIDTDAIATQERNERIQAEIDSINIQFPELKKYYTLLDRAGRGTFSKVYRAHDLLYEKYMPWTLQKKLESSFDGNHHYVAIKLIYGISSPKRVANEISCLADLRGLPCITPMITAFRNEDVTYLVLPYIEFDHFEDIYPTMSLLDLKHYISEMLIGLKCVHDKGIVHRDVKPGNFLYNRKTKMGYLGDFGLAQRSTHLEIHKPGQPAAPLDSVYAQPQDSPAGYFIHDKRKFISVDRSGTRSFRAPEIYLNSIRQTTAMDIWAVGVILISFLSNLYPYFDPEDSAAGIIELMTTFGVKQVNEFATFYGRNIKTNIPDMPENPVNMDELCRQFNREAIDKWDREDYLLAIDLTKSCLQLIDAKRPSAAEALKHPFLKEAMLTKSHN